MKKIFTLLLAVSFFSFCANAQGTDLVKYLPGKASIIIDIDGGSLSQKVSRQDLKELKFLDSLFQKAKAGSKELFVDPSESGINNHDHFYVIMNMKKDGESESGSVTVFGKVADEPKLSQVLQKVKDKEITRKTSGQIKMMMSQDFVLGWNNSVFVIHAVMPFKKWLGKETKVTLAEKKKELLILEKKCIELLTPKQQAFSVNKDFETFKQSKGDFKIWIDSKSMMDDFKQKGPWSAFGMNKLMQPDHQAIVVNFENGKTVSNSYSYFNETTLPIVKNTYGDKLNAELFKNIPPGNLFGLYAASFKPDGIKNFLESSGIMKEFKKEDKGPDFDPMVILENAKGDVVMAVTLPEQVYDDNAEPKNPFSSLNIFFAATVKDEAKVNKLIDSLKWVFEEKKKQNEVDTTDSDVIVKESSWFKDVKLSTKVENGTFYLTINGARQIELVSTTRYDALVNEYGQRPTLMMFDMKTLMSLLTGFISKMPHSEAESQEQTEIFSMFEVFDKMIISGGKFENGVMVTTQELKFTNTDENSLKQMMKMIDLAFSALGKIGRKGTVKDIELKEN